MNILNIEKTFDLSTGEIKQIIKNFHSEMSRGLSGRKSSLAMLPTFADVPTGNEKGRFIALDLGGTNFRILEVMLKGRGAIRVTAESKFCLKKKDITGTGAKLFDFIADSIKRFMRANKISFSVEENLGFTFSFPVQQTNIASGILLCWNKGFSAKNAVGNNIVQMLNEALLRKGISNIKTAALINDTLGTLAAKRYSDHNCDMGVIFGTGTNACYPEKISKIAKSPGLKTNSGYMAINIEWGNFNKLPRTAYDKKIDISTNNPGRQRLEKMVSGLYLGEIARVILLDLVKRKMLFENNAPAYFIKYSRGKPHSINLLYDGAAKSLPRGILLREELLAKQHPCVDARKRAVIKPWKLDTKYVSEMENDNSNQLTIIEKVLTELDIAKSTCKDRIIVKQICRFVLKRSAQISASAIAAVILWMDPKIKRRHTVAIDGSLFEKCPGYREYLGSALRIIFKRNSGRIYLTLAKDGSGKGAAIVAATASQM